MKDSNTTASDFIQLSLIKHGIWWKKKFFLHLSLPVIHPFLQGDQAAGLSVYFKGKAWHISIVVIEGIRGLIPGNANLGWSFVFFFFFCQVLHTLGDFLPFEIQRQVGPPHLQKWKPSHPFFSWPPLQDRTFAYELASESQLNHTRQNKKTKIELGTAWILFLVAVVVGGCKASGFRCWSECTLSGIIKCLVGAAWFLSSILHIVAVVPGCLALSVSL